MLGCAGAAPLNGPTRWGSLPSCSATALRPQRAEASKRMITARLTQLIGYSLSSAVSAAEKNHWNRAVAGAPSRSMERGLPARVEHAPATPLRLRCHRKLWRHRTPRPPSSGRVPRQELRPWELIAKQQRGVGSVRLVQFEKA